MKSDELKVPIKCTNVVQELIVIHWKYSNQIFYLVTKSLNELAL